MSRGRLGLGETNAHTRTYVTRALHGTKGRLNPGHGSALGQSTAHVSRGQPACQAAGRAERGRAGLGPTEEEGGGQRLTLGLGSFFWQSY